MIRTPFIAAMLIAAPAFAQSASVYYADLNLQSAAGQATLEHRINGAARTVCGGSPDAPDLTTVTRYNDCVTSARASAEKAMQTAQSGTVSVASR